MDGVHPSQRRISCEACKKYKKKCIRLRPEDLTCVKCASLGIFCDPGQKKKVGRPKGRTVASTPPSDGSTHGAGGTGKTRGRTHADAESMPLSVMLPPPRPTSTFNVPSWPTFMTDAWFRGIGLDGNAASKSLLSTDHGPEPPPPVNRALGITASMTQRPATFIVQGNKFSRSPRRFTSDCDISDTASQLERMMTELRLRRSTVELHRQNMTLDTAIYRKGPLFQDDATLASMVMETSEDLLQIFSCLLRQQKKNAGYTSEGFAALLRAATNVYCQLLAFYELFIELLTARAERLAGPMVAIPDMTLDDAPVNGLPAQGVLFCNTSLTLLRRFDEVLGIGSTRGQGLLDRGQIKSLWDTLDHSVGFNAGNAPMRPVDMIRLFYLSINVLEKVASSTDQAATSLTIDASSLDQWSLY